MIYCFLAKGFEEIEAVTLIDILRRDNIEVVTVGIGSKEVTGAHDITIKADIEEKDINIEKMNGIFLPGGMPGTLNLEKSSTVTEAIEYAVKNNLLISAICAAPLILGRMGILKGKKATVYPGFEEELKGAIHTGDFVTKDNNIITGKGPGSAIEFSLEVLKYIKGIDKAKEIRGTLQCPTNK